MSKRVSRYVQLCVTSLSVVPKRQQLSLEVKKLFCEFCHFTAFKVKGSSKKVTFFRDESLVY